MEKIQSEIELMEKANVEPKTWTMQGEVTAANRPVGSALEANLDFEHNVRPTPVITEEVTASIEEMIQKRIIELFKGLSKIQPLTNASCDSSTLISYPQASSPSTSNLFHQFIKNKKCIPPSWVLNSFCIQKSSDTNDSMWYRIAGKVGREQ
ncbi:U3 small nucleolar ribonucleoprotein MPP10-like [Trifolium medium]|uniref:U3 small nucleolar ribonucleoprotein MPP10-like n=1 Tax=Trifolium medium TaxID=97028 RepID=A0A392PF97_9FABA|nr:U3 small nucleolar ribonucleoprotein MPP10-like [Trifolium medium]